MDSNQLKSRIVAAARAQPAPTRKEFAVRSAVVLALALATPVLELLFVGGAHRGERPWSLVLATTGGGLALAFGAIWTALGRGGRIAGRARVWLISMAALLPPAWVVWKVVWSMQYEGMAAPWTNRPGARCFALTLAFSLCPLIALAFVRRGSDPTHPRSLGAALGVAAGTYAAVMVDVWCPIGNLSHVVLGHALPVVLLGLVGFAIGRRVLGFGGR
jgi:hypothetical protein